MKKYLCRIVRNGEDVVCESKSAEFAEAALQSVICRKRDLLEKHGCATSFGKLGKVANDEFSSVNGDTAFVVRMVEADGAKA